MEKKGKDVPAASYKEVLDDLFAEVRKLEPGWDGYLDGIYSSYLDHMRWLDKSPRGMTTVEVGGFPFFFSHCLQRLGYEPVIIDLAPERMQRFIERHDLKVLCIDIERQPLPFGDGSVDLIVCTDTFEHLRIDPIFVLEEMARVLAPNGILYLTTPNFYRLGNIARIVTGNGPANHPLKEYLKIRRVGHMGHVREYTAHEIESLLEFAGFSAIELQYTSPGKSKHGPIVDILHGCITRMRPQLVVTAKKRPGKSPHSPAA